MQERELVSRQEAAGNAVGAPWCLLGSCSGTVWRHHQLSQGSEAGTPDSLDPALGPPRDQYRLAHSKGSTGPHGACGLRAAGSHGPFLPGGRAWVLRCPPSSPLRIHLPAQPSRGPPLGPDATGSFLTPVPSPWVWAALPVPSTAQGLAPGTGPQATRKVPALADQVAPVPVPLPAPVFCQVPRLKPCLHPSGVACVLGRLVLPMTVPKSHDSCASFSRLEAP